MEAALGHGRQKDPTSVASAPRFANANYRAASNNINRISGLEKTLIKAQF